MLKVLLWNKKKKKRILPRKLARQFSTNTTKFTTEASELFAVVANRSEQTLNQNVAVEVCKVSYKRTSGLTVKGKQVSVRYCWEVR